MKMALFNRKIGPKMTFEFEDPATRRKGLFEKFQHVLTCTCPNNFFIIKVWERYGNGNDITGLRVKGTILRERGFLFYWQGNKGYGNDITEKNICSTSIILLILFFSLLEKKLSIEKLNKFISAKFKLHLVERISIKNRIFP